MNNMTAIAFNMKKSEKRLPDQDTFGYFAICNDNINNYVGTKQPNYFMGILEADHFRDSLVAFHDSVDNFWADLLQFPDDFHQANREMYKSALQQLRLGIRDGGSGCYRNEPLLSVTQYSTLSATLKWCAQHPANFTWLPVSIEAILKRSLQAIIPHVQQWNLLVAETMPSTEIRHKKEIPLRIPPPDMVQDWPDRPFLREAILVGTSNQN
jgi:hypothetical protein